MAHKSSTYLETRFGSMQDGLDFIQLIGWLLSIGITLPVMASLLVSPVLAFIMALFFALGTIWIMILWKKGISILLSPIDTGLFLIFLTVVITTCFSIDPSRGMRMVWQWSALIVLFYMMLSLFQAKLSFHPFVKALLLVTTFFVLFGYFELFVWLFNWYTGHEGALFPLPRLIRISGLFWGPNSFGGLLAMMLALALVMVVEFKQYRSTWWLIWLVVTAVMLIATKSRGAWVSLSVALSIYGLSKVWIKSIRENVSLKVWIYVLLAILGGGAMLVILLLVIRPTTFVMDTPILVRLELWQVALDSWMQRPWFGNGPNTYPTLQMQSTAVYIRRHHRGAHNFYMNTLAEMGLAGIMATSLFVVQMLWFLWQRRKFWNQWTFVFFIPLIVTFVHAQSDLTWLRTLVIASILLAGLVATLSPHSKKIVMPLWHSLMLLSWCFIWLLLIVSGIVGWKSVKQYEDGVASIRGNDWKRASHLFSEGQKLTPYDDSLFLYASGFSDGVLAVNDNSYLSSAIKEQERLIALEPGWSVHRANLAGLYKQAGRVDEALYAMQQAIKLTPNIPLYYLNLGIWYEENGEREMAVSTYHQLYQMPYTWHDASFWMMGAAAEGVDDAYRGEADRGYKLLIAGRIDDALDVFDDAVKQHQTFDNYLGLGISQLYAGDLEKSSLSFAQAGSSQSDVRREVLNIWKAALSDASEAEMNVAIMKLKLQRYYSVDESQKFVGMHTFYTHTLFGRVPIPYEILPQLSCFSLSPFEGLHMQLLQKWYISQDDMGYANSIYEIITSDNGVSPCMLYSD